MEGKTSLPQIFLLNLFTWSYFSGVFTSFFPAARDTTELEISMPIITTEPQLLETALGKIDKMALLSCIDFLFIFILATIFGSFVLL